MSIAKKLSNIPVFSALDKAALSRLESCLVRRRFKSGQVLFHMGDEGGVLYIINKGKVKVTIPSTLGEEYILAILSAGEILGELSLFDGKPRSATVQAMVETEILCLHREDFLEILRSRFDVVVRVLEVLTQRLRDTDVSLAETHFLDIMSRLSKKILELGEIHGVNEGDQVRIDVKMTQKDLASMVGATRESVNKQFKILRDKGIIRMKDGFIEILDPEKLARRTRKHAI